MIIGSSPFILAQTTLSNNALFRDHQVRVLIFILIISIALIYFFARPYVEGNF